MIPGLEILDQPLRMLPCVLPIQKVSPCPVDLRVHSRPFAVGCRRSSRYAWIGNQALEPCFWS